jgi:hypothetical protein
MSSEMRLSADGLYYWDGRLWVSTLSPDGSSRWDGTRWVPVPPRMAPPPVYAPAYAPVYAPVPVTRSRRVPTSWTRPLQVAVAAAFGLYALYTISAPLWLAGPMQQYMRQTALQQAQQAPEIYPDPNQYADMMASFVTIGLAVSVIIGLAIAVVVVIGALKRWTWMFYAVLVLTGLQVLGLPFQVASAIGLVNMTSAAAAYPPAVAWVGVAWGLLAIAMLAWMLVALLTRGPWAMQKELAGQ